MQKIHLRLASLFSVVCIMLASCSLPSLSGLDNDAGKVLHLQTNMLLAETKSWNLGRYNGYWLFSFPEKAYYNNFINTTVPSYDTFMHDPSRFQIWKGDALHGWTRFAGVVGKGTAFHVVEVAPKMSGNSQWVTIQLDDGAYRGANVILGNPKNVLPEARS